MQKYDAKRDPKVYAALSLLGASGCTPIRTAPVDPKVLGEHSIHYEQAGVALAAKNSTDLKDGMNLVRKIYRIQEGQIIVTKTEQDGESSYQIGGYRLTKELPPQDKLAAIVKEAAGKDRIATPQEVENYFNQVVKKYGDNPNEIGAAPSGDASADLIHSIYGQNPDKGKNVPKKINEIIVQEDRKNNKKDDKEGGFIEDVGFVLGGAIVIGAVGYAAYKLVRAAKRMWPSRNKPSGKPGSIAGYPSRDTDDEQDPSDEIDDEQKN